MPSCRLPKQSLLIRMTTRMLGGPRHNPMLTLANKPRIDRANSFFSWESEHGGKLKRPRTYVVLGKWLYWGQLPILEFSERTKENPLPRSSGVPGGYQLPIYIPSNKYKESIILFREMEIPNNPKKVSRKRLKTYIGCGRRNVASTPKNWYLDTKNSHPRKKTPSMKSFQLCDRK